MSHELHAPTTAHRHDEAPAHPASPPRIPKAARQRYHQALEALLFNSDGTPAPAFAEVIPHEMQEKWGFSPNNKKAVTLDTIIQFSEHDRNMLDYFSSYMSAHILNTYYAAFADHLIDSPAPQQNIFRR
jgi:hypothetical protein